MLFVTGPLDSVDLAICFANIISLGFGFAFMIYSLAYLVTAFRKFVDDSIR